MLTPQRLILGMCSLSCLGVRHHHHHHHHHRQPSMFNCWTKAYLLLDHSSRSSAISAQLLPIYFLKSFVQRVFGLPLILLPLGFHFNISDVKLFLALDT